jgi:hypothetical protein
LNHNDLQEIASLHTSNGLLAILSDGQQINDAARLGSGRTTELDHLPLGTATPVVRDQPLRHHARPLRGVPRLLAWSRDVPH